uniref:Uncharacterized protein n=1 Tax=Rhipicephalus pulchellus TaxID=72859 RepID=L7LZY5_RHIPC
MFTITVTRYLLYLILIIGMSLIYLQLNPYPNSNTGECKDSRQSENVFKNEMVKIFLKSEAAIAVLLLQQISALKKCKCHDHLRSETKQFVKN